MVLLQILSSMFMLGLVLADGYDSGTTATVAILIVGLIDSVLWQNQEME